MTTDPDQGTSLPRSLADGGRVARSRRLGSSGAARSLRLELLPMMQEAGVPATQPKVYPAHNVIEG